MKNADRRQFLRNVSLGSLAALTLPQIVSAAVPAADKNKKVTLKKDAVVLFQGDSITDAGRNRQQETVNSGFGNGYALLAASQLLMQHPEKGLQLHNRGISGNKVYQLAERWDNDCLQLKPDVLSILIGVNDFWHGLNGKYNGTVKTYHDDYDTLLNRTKQALPDVQLIIGEPFAVRGAKTVNDSWFPSFDEYRAAARELAGKYNAVFIPYHSIFEKALKSAPAPYWTHDGVHPGMAGAELMAQAWLQTLKG